ncbi:YihY family inner membrane protein [Sneathiella sp. P13V-1]|uniref:YhjD/YihY/BrkB family envelope integrity protein n=1 Tax=Sneathiella sp. P13V-1 TaxID=2697366 RepID=UPI00187B7386|nr:YhjD/YihY/BrkB family envelope integrity protein [Sneathiella sp. P13V-1]MBE7635640.1 YihY family inner membrane protein [Sneathiella sp. P13V-1]
MGNIIKDILLDILRHFARRNCPRMATALSYQTLLAIVPLFILAISLLTYVDAFYTLQEDILFFLFDNFLPGTIANVYDMLQDLVLNAKQLTFVGLAGLAVTAVLLFLGIEDSFREIWRVNSTRNIFVRLFAYHFFIVIGPIALSSSLTLVTWLSSLTEEASGISFEGIAPYFNFVLPFLLSFVILFSLYKLVPAQKVYWTHAGIGAGIAASLFVLGKQIFGYYLLLFPGYELIYGALAILPLFLVWLYVSWLMVMLGATITAVLGFHLNGNLTPRENPIELYS